MSTLQPITKIYKSYVQSLRAIKTNVQAEFEDMVKTYRNKFVSDIENLRDKHPEMLAINYTPKMTDKTASKIVSVIAENVKENYSFPALRSDEVLIDKIMSDICVVPSFTSLDSNFKLTTDKDCLNDWLIMLLLSMPAKSVKLHIVDTEGKMLTDFLYANLHKDLYNGKPITSETDYTQLLENLNQRVISCVQRYTDVVAYNEKHKRIIMPYEVVVIVSEPKNLRDRIQTLKKSLSKNGKLGGVFMVLVNESQMAVDDAKYLPGFLTVKEKCLIKPTPFFTIPALLNASIKYLNECAAAEVEKQIIKMDIRKENNNPCYSDPDNNIMISVGMDGLDEVQAKFDLVSHVHSFVVGQSGSGKSVFLHNIVSGIMLNYSPADIEMYLMDFKLGGVEFNRYKDEKHIHAMMVDNSDYRVTLEILRELKNRMTERGKLFRSEAVTNIAEYNAIASERMPHIFLVADECHELFRRGTDVPHDVSTEINEILTKIAKEGRNQGVHMIMATQTLSGTDISNEILANITDFYLLKCSPIDSEKLVPNSSKVTSSLTTGNIYYRNPDYSTTFQAYYTPKEDVVKVMKAIDAKSKKYKSNLKFYFNGATIHYFDEHVIKQNLKLCKKYPVAFVGKSIDLNQDDVRIPLKDDISENILIVGQNDEEQATRVTVNIMQSIIKASEKLEDDLKIYIIDCLKNDEGKYADLIDRFEEEGLIEVVKQKNIASFMKKMAKDIQSEKTESSIILIVGQDKFRALKLNIELEESEDATDDLGLAKASFSIGFSSQGNHDNSIRTIGEALNVILEKGPELGVHTVLQLEKVSNYLFKDYISPKDVYKSFKHLILLKSEASTSSQLHLDDAVRLEQLSKDEERLRAYYYAEENDSYTLFTPYSPINIK